MKKKKPSKKSKESPIINVTEKQLRLCWDEIILPRSNKTLAESKYSYTFKRFVKKLRYLNEV